MKKTNLFRTIILALAVALTVSLCACGNSKSEAVSSDIASQSELTAAQQVENHLLDEFTKMYGENMELCEFKTSKIYSAEEIAEEAELFQDYNFSDNDIVFAATYDLKAPDGTDPIPLTPANGELDGQWVRDKYACGYLKFVSEGEYVLESWGTSF